MGSNALKENAGLRPKNSDRLRFPDRGRECFAEKKAKDTQERTTK
jgi:hypothetical protein